MTFYFYRNTFLKQIQLYIYFTHSDVIQNPNDIKGEASHNIWDSVFHRKKVEQIMLGSGKMHLKRRAHPKNVNDLIYSLSRYPSCLWLSSLRRIQSDIFLKSPGSSKLYNNSGWVLFSNSPKEVQESTSILNNANASHGSGGCVLQLAEARYYH